MDQKFDSDGNEDTVNWNKIISSGSDDWYDERPYSVAIDGSDNVYVVGHGFNLFSGYSGCDWWLKKFDSDGNEDTSNWDKKFGSGDYYDDNAYSVVIDNYDNVYVVGKTGNVMTEDFDWWIKKFDSSGNEDTAYWNKIIDGNGGQDAAQSVVIDGSGGLYVAGYGTDLLGSTGKDWWIKKFEGQDYNPLPVDLTSFYGEATSLGVQLYWETASEYQNKGFYLYRNDVKISELIPGQGSTTEANQYSFLDKDVEGNTSYRYRISDVQQETEKETFHQEITIFTGDILEPNPDNLPVKFALHPNMPNPFNPTTHIKFDLPQSANITLWVYDVSGKLVKTLSENKSMEAGYHSIEWSGIDSYGKSVPSGVYFYRLNASGLFEDIRKMVLMK